MASIVLFIAIISIAIFIISFWKRSETGAASLIVFSIVLTIWGILKSITVAEPLEIQNLIILISANIVASSIITFVIEYSNRREWLNIRYFVMLLGLPLLSLILFLTSRNRIPLSEFYSIAEIFTLENSWLWICILNIIGLQIIASILLLHTIIRIPKLHRLQPILIFLGISIPCFTGIFSLFGWIHIAYFDLSPIGFVFTGAILTYGLFRNEILDIFPLTREMVIETIGDGWMILDAKNRIIDLNPAAEELIGISREELFGKPAEIVLGDWPNLKPAQDPREKEFKGSVNLRGEWKYLNIRISPLVNRDDTQVGQVIVWRDITERRKGDDARQRARDEMFTLLHAISGTASRALNLDDFLAESIYQIVYSFQSQLSVIYLLEENHKETNGTPKLSLAAHQGLPVWSIDGMTSISEANEMIGWVLRHHEPLVIPDISQDPRVPENMQQLGRASILLVPMLIEGQIIGIIGLGRNEGPSYSKDEIARLTVVADEVAIFIQSNRQRQSAIAIAERQRLARDLHDSVTQKLYGLLTLTEAAQAGFEAGSTDMPAQVLSRIGENARQALKEMRLFLFELQPIDLERDGLVAVLHQRLAAVEGRADIKARLLADEDISLPLHYEIALYYIAQEALNNVLKHANAKSVTVRLKKRKVNFLLEIEDDGCGFDPQETDGAGMGLRSMKERVVQVGGRLKILTAPGKGTRISVIINRAKNPKLN